MQKLFIPECCAVVVVGWVSSLTHSLRLLKCFENFQFDFLLSLASSPADVVCSAFRFCSFRENLFRSHSCFHFELNSVFSRLLHHASTPAPSFNLHFLSRLVWFFFLTRNFSYSSFPFVCATTTLAVWIFEKFQILSLTVAGIIWMIYEFIYMRWVDNLWWIFLSLVLPHFSPLPILRLLHDGRKIVSKSTENFTFIRLPHLNFKFHFHFWYPIEKGSRECIGVHSMEILNSNSLFPHDSRVFFSDFSTHLHFTESNR